MRLKAFSFCLLALAIGPFATLNAAELTKITVDADAWEAGDVPKDVFVVEGNIKIEAKDGNKAIVILGTAIVDACAQVGVSAAGESTIQARVFGSRRARSMPRFGVSVHGMSGYRLLVNGVKKQLELVKGDQVLATAPYTWTSETWTNLKLEVRRAAPGGDDWTITGKAWADGSAEPAEPQIKHADKKLKGQGKAGLWATPYSETSVYFDDVKLELETAPAASS